MTADKVFYTDGHSVTINDKGFIIKKKQYRLPGILGFQFRTIKPMRTPGLIVALIGTCIALAGAMPLVANYTPELMIIGMQVASHYLIVALGLITFIVGVSSIILVKPRYAVHISTAEGENDVIISPQREYIRQIVDALTRATQSLNN